MSAEHPVASTLTDRELLDAVLLRALDERFSATKVTRWLELAVEINAGNRDMFPNEIKEATSPGRRASCASSFGGAMPEQRNDSSAAHTEARRQFDYGFYPEEAVALFRAVASSDYRNGLGQVYVALGDLVRDENGHVPGHTDYRGPTWA